MSTFIEGMYICLTITWPIVLLLGIGTAFLMAKYDCNY